MGLRSQRQIKQKQAQKRQTKRKRLTAKGANLSDYYYGKYFLKVGA